MAVSLAKTDCCGCKACSQACPRHCIHFVFDEEGFSYPEIDSAKCIECGKCSKACPALHIQPVREPLSVFAAKNTIRNDLCFSSSGGIFPVLARKIIQQNGIVVGACFDENWNVILAETTSVDGLGKFYSSKYVQSDTRSTFINTLNHLKAGKSVLFSGTSCQIAGLKTFLGKEYEKLYTVDVICHGVPSPMVWQKYLHDTFGGSSNVEKVEFRCKDYGWLNFCLKVQYRYSIFGLQFKRISRLPNTLNPFMIGFLKNVFLRPSCYKCKYRCGKSGSDITLGDCWGVKEIASDFYDSAGVSSVLCNTEKGQKLLEQCPMSKIAVSYSDTLRYNIALEQSPKCPPERTVFMTLFRENIPFPKIVRRIFPRTRLRILFIFLRNQLSIYRFILKKLLGK